MKYSKTVYVVNFFLYKYFALKKVIFVRCKLFQRRKLQLCLTTRSEMFTLNEAIRKMVTSSAADPLYFQGIQIQQRLFLYPNLANCVLVKIWTQVDPNPVRSVKESVLYASQPLYQLQLSTKRNYTLVLTIFFFFNSGTCEDELQGDCLKTAFS